MSCSRVQRDNRKDNRSLYKELTRALERWHRDPHVRARREGEAFLPDTPVSSCLSHDPTAQGSLTQTSSCPKKGRNKQPRHNSVCGFHSSPGSWPGSTRGSIKQHVTFRPKTAHSVSHVSRETCFVNTSATLFALSTFCSRNRPVDTQD